MWVYGSGFPKSLDVSKAIDATIQYGGSSPKQLRARDGRKVGNVGTNMHTHRSGHNDVSEDKEANPVIIDAAKEWEGWGTALKPAWEPIILARKPLASAVSRTYGTVANNVLEHGVGGLNIDGCRVGTENLEYKTTSYQEAHTGEFSGQEQTNHTTGHKQVEGRWPANLIHDGSDEVVELFPNEAARFFYCAKSSKKERDMGLQDTETYSAGDMTGGRKEGGSDGLNSPRAGAGRTSGGHNNHPTVKPLALMQYLCRLITPPGGVVLDPFMGSGSTLVAAQAEGFNSIGIDTEESYCEIAVRRINESNA